MLAEERARGRRDGLYAARDIAAEAVLEAADIEVKRPGGARHRRRGADRLGRFELAARGERPTQDVNEFRAAIDAGRPGSSAAVRGPARRPTGSPRHSGNRC